MYAIIAGGGNVGFFLARELIEQGHEILIIEPNGERAEFIANELGNVVLRGNADEASTLAEAGAERADVIIAVTGDDPRNLVLCQVAKRRFGTHRTIARINDPRDESLFLMLGIDATVNATQVMLSVLEQEIPQANLVPLLRLRNTDIEVVEALVAVQEHARLVGRSTALAMIAAPAGAYQVVPAVSATAVARDDVVQGEIAGTNTAVLAGLVIADEDLAARQAHARTGPLDHVDQPNNGWSWKQTIRRSNRDFGVFEHLRLAAIH